MGDWALSRSLSLSLSLSLYSVGNKLDGGNSERHSLLSSYVTFSFTNPIGTNRCVYEELVSYWLRECKKQVCDSRATELFQ
jgi:hypothetical protein